jgi:hypothetical protein
MSGTNSILFKDNKNQLKSFSIDFGTKLGISPEKMYEYAILSLRYYSSSEQGRFQYRAFQSLENRWYNSLKVGTPDYSIYQEEIYLGDVWACWQVYSKKYLKNILKIAKTTLVDVNSVIDIGNGIGYTTLGLKEIFPSADVFGLNYKDSYQMKYCRTHTGITMVDDIKGIGKQIDLVFASEYFEHIYKPIEHLDDILDKLKPKYLIIANSFRSVSLGHFPIFEHKGQKISNKAIGRLFNKHLRDRGYTNVRSGFWNNRPAIWKKVNKNES